VIEGGEGADFSFEQGVGEALVIVETLGIGSAGAIGQDTRPGNGKTVAGQV
jgi:hypothetical protein